MSESGWVSMHRGWVDHPIFSQKEFCQRMAWYWLIENACWKPTKTRINSKIIELQRGQLSYSFRYLAKAWGWELRRVTRFIHGLKTATMLTTESATGQLVVTICNYSKYQDKQELSPQDVPRNPPQKRNTRATNKNKGTREQETKIPKESLFDLPPTDGVKYGKSRRRQKPTEFITETFGPDIKGISLASELGVDIDTECRKFINHYLAKGEARADWQASFRTWVENAARFSIERQQRQADGRRNVQDVTGATLRAIEIRQQRQA